ncbi:MAG: hypothetical protein QM731_16995 [Chitinophagaceae bacterium]
MPANRNKNSYQTFISSFIQKVYVVCPACSKQAIVTAPPFPDLRPQQAAIKVTCINCGYNKRYQDMLAAGKAPRFKHILIGTTVDPYFKLPLWLQTNCCGSTLWAYNYEHLDFLQELVSAKLRERNTVVTSNGSIASRLPQWLTARHNRDAVIKTIEYLQHK